MNNKFYIVNVEAAIRRNDKWLLIKRSDLESTAPGRIAFCGGKVEGSQIENNILEETLIREVKEEVGIEVENIQYAQSNFFISDSNHPVINITFTCDFKSGSPRIDDFEEVEGIVWLTKEEILGNNVILKHTKQVVLQIDPNLQ